MPRGNHLFARRCTRIFADSRRRRGVLLAEDSMELFLVLLFLLGVALANFKQDLAAGDLNFVLGNAVRLVEALVLGFAREAAIAN